MIAAATTSTTAPSAPALRVAGDEYVRRRAEDTLLYELVAAETEALRRAVAEASPFGRGLPRHVDKELDAFLDCGLLDRGFARVVCSRCRAEHLVAFSCKG